MMADVNELLAAAEAAHDAGRLGDAERLYRQILATEPRCAAALNGLGFLAHQLGRNEDAIRLMEQSIQLEPAAAEYHNNLAGVLRAMGRADAAVKHFRRAVELQPSFWQAWFNLGSLLRERDDIEGAIECYRRVVAINPGFADAHNDLGAMLAQRRRWPEAEAAFREAIRQNPRMAVAHGNLGNVLIDLGRPEEAIACHRKVLDIDPGSAEAWHNLALAYQSKVAMDEAEECYRKAIALRPDYVEALNNLGSLLKELWRLDEGMEILRQAVKVRPGYARAHSNLLLDMHYDSRFAPQAIFNEHLNWARRHAAITPVSHALHTNNRDRTRRMRIAYLSPDFRRHSVAFFIEPILANHDPRAFEVSCYSTSPRTDSVTERLWAMAGTWRDVAGWTDQRIADQIRADAIDILIDLAGHTAGGRLRVLSFKPAPVQMTYVGYPNTSGLAAVDYRITDAYCDPPGSEALYTEQLLRLEPCFLCYRPREDCPDVNDLPANRAGYVTFGCFNNIAKVSPQALDAWTAILRSVPGSKLLLKDRGFASARTRGLIMTALADRDIGGGRVDLAGYEPSHQQHMAGYGRIDVALDTFPYCGTTTTCDALWMGVPVVSLAGKTHVSRVGGTLLRTVGFPQMLAASAEEYVRIAADLTQDVPRLAAMRREVRQRMRSSPLMDERGFTHRLEDAYRRAWATWVNSPAR